MIGKDMSLDGGRIESATWAMLDALKGVGYRPAGKRSRRGHRLLAEISSDFLSRATTLLVGLRFEVGTSHFKDQLHLGIVSGANSSASGPRRLKMEAVRYLRKSLGQRHETMPRDRAVNILDIQEVAVYWAATLSIRGWRGVADYKFMELLKREVSWVLLEYGYHFASGKSINCPFITMWQDHEFWRHIAILDGVSVTAINAEKELLRRSSCTKGCPGYLAEPRCIQAPLGMSA